jgi:hypothetical protein
VMCCILFLSINSGCVIVFVGRESCLVDKNKTCRTKLIEHTLPGQIYI